MENAPAFQFDILGSLWDPLRIEQAIVSLGLEDRVHVHGFVSESELDEFIANAHLAFNLRFPTMGEASSGYPSVLEPRDSGAGVRRWLVPGLAG